MLPLPAYKLHLFLPSTFHTMFLHPEGKLGNGHLRGTKGGTTLWVMTMIASAVA
jgi:hypothetical protein